jgi:phosphoglucosamine mutase
VRVARRRDFSAEPAVAKAVAAAERELGATGRVLLRASGTEPLVRVMAEGRSRARVRACARRIAAAVERAAAA